MAGATKPTISSGIKKPKKEENTELNVAKHLASHSGNINPAPIPAAIAMMTLMSRRIFYN